MCNGIFKNAVFGDKFKTRDGKDVIYLSSERHRDRHGNLTEWTYHNVVVNINGLQPFEDDATLSDGQMMGILITVIIVNLIMIFIIGCALLDKYR